MSSGEGKRIGFRYCRRAFHALAACQTSTKSATEVVRTMRVSHCWLMARESTLNRRPRGSTRWSMPTRIFGGKQAPDFTLEDANGRRVSLADVKGKEVVGCFHH